jgi:dTDP-glucose 4,6-dehydratase
MGKTYVVIGSNCFTGSHIVDALLEDPSRRVIGISRSPEYRDFFLPYKKSPQGDFRFFQMDLVRDFDSVVDLLDELKPAFVINVAALSEVGFSNTSPVEYFDINTRAVVALCNTLRTRPYLERYVHISSAEILGSCQEPIAEDAAFFPSTPYAVSKAAADMYIGTLQSNFGFPAILVRSTNVYGRHQQPFKIIPRTIIYLKMGRRIQLHGGGVSEKCFVHVRDVVDGLLRTLDQGGHGTYHFSVRSERSIADTVRLVCEQMGCDYEASVDVVGERLGQDSRYLLDCTRAMQELGWSPRIEFEEGVRETIEWVEANWDDIEREPLVYEHKV